MPAHCNYWNTYHLVERQKKKAQRRRQKRSMFRTFCALVGLLLTIWGVAE